MRRSFVAPLAAGVALAAVSSAPAATTLSLTMRVTPNQAGSESRPQDAKIVFVEAAATTIDGKLPPPATRVVLHLSPGFRYHNDRFPSCDAATLQRAGLAGCPPGAKVGEGCALAGAVLAGQEVTAGATVHIVNDARDGKVLLFGDARAGVTCGGHPPSPVTVPVVLEGTWRPAGAGAMDLDFPATSTEIVPGVPLTIEKFEGVFGTAATIKARRVSYIVSIGCPDGVWSFSADFSFASTGEELTAASDVPCSIARRLSTPARR